VHIRLVKGAYVEPPDRALPYGEATDVAYVHLAHRLADAGTPGMAGRQARSTGEA